MTTRWWWWAVGGVVFAAPPVGAFDAFEIQVYESDTAEPGGAGVEVHLNSVLAGSRHPSPEGEYPTHGVTHVTVEPHLGLLDWLEAGFYVQSAWRNGVPEPAGIKLRSKVRYPHRVAGIFGFALNGELSAVPPRFEVVRYGSEMRPILDAELGPFYASVNPIIAVTFAGPDAFRPELEPAWTLVYRMGDVVSVGVEHYASLGPVDAPLALRDQVHHVFGVLNLQQGHVALHFGAGMGAGEERFIVKSILSGELGP